MDSYHINCWTWAGITSAAQRSPKARRRSCADAYLTLPVSGCVWTLIPDFFPFSEIFLPTESCSCLSVRPPTPGSLTSGPSVHQQAFP